MANLDITKLKGTLPAFIYDQLPMVIDKFKINTINRMAMFLGQCDVESSSFKKLKEDLYYTKERLAVVFPSRFAIDPKAKVKIPNDLAKRVEKNATLTANSIYGGRMGNNNLNDGFTYSGKGCIMLTGKSNYSDFDKFVDDDILNNPDLISTKYALVSAAWFFTVHNLNAISDQGITVNTITKVSEIINGGLIGIDDRIKAVGTKYYNLLTK